MMKHKLILAALTLSLGIINTNAQTARTLPILESSTDARSYGMGNTLLGNTDRMYLYVNPSAFLYTDKKLSIDASTEIYSKAEFGRLMQYNVAASYNFLKCHAVSVGYRYMGGLTFHKINGAMQEKQSFKPFDWTIDLAYAFRISDRFSAYASGTFFQSYTGVTAEGATFSVGASYRNEMNFGKMPAMLTLGARVMDIGASFSYNNSKTTYDLPSSIAMGGDLGVQVAERHRVTVAMGGRYFFLPSEAKALRVNAGFEYTFDNMLSARVGYDCRQKEPNFFTVGLGARLFKNFKLDAAYGWTDSDALKTNTFMLGLGIDL